MPARKAAAKTTTTKAEQETFMPTEQTEQQSDVLTDLTEYAHKLATNGKADEAALVTRVAETIEVLRKEVKAQTVLNEYHEQCRQLAEDKLRQLMLS